MSFPLLIIIWILNRPNWSRGRKVYDTGHWPTFERREVGSSPSTVISIVFEVLRTKILKMESF